MVNRSFRVHLSRLTLLALATVIVAGLTGHWLAIAALAIAGYLAWQLANLYRLHRWLREPGEEPPQGSGLWADLFDGLYRLQRENRSEREQREQVIEEFRQATNAFPDATVIIDSALNINWFNRSAQDWLEFKKPDDLGQPIGNLIRDPEFTQWLEDENEEPRQYILNSPNDDLQTLQCIRVDYRKDQSLLVFRDISDIVRLDKIRQDFVANVSHELRTPLTVVMGYLETIQADCPPDLAGPIERMSEQSNGMLALLDDLLELSRLQDPELSSQKHPVNVAELLPEIIVQAEELSQGRHELITTVDASILVIGNDRDLACAFLNLLTNAIRYSPDGGRILISWQLSEGQPEFSIKDTGIGIAAKDIPRLTERFFRTSADRARSTGGTGLGLAIVKHILNDHQAQLKIDSELGKGSTFTCRFPKKSLVGNPADKQLG